MSTSKIPEILRNHEASLLDDWTLEQLRGRELSARLSDAGVRTQSRRFLQSLQEATTSRFA